MNLSLLLVETAAVLSAAAYILASRHLPRR